jgi:hypothetical protein
MGCIDGVAIIPLVPLHATEDVVYTGRATTPMFLTTKVRSNVACNVE